MKFTTFRLRIFSGKPVRLIVFSIFFAISIPGCIKQRAPAPMVERYVFEYPPPAFTGLAQIQETLKVERFSVAKAYNTLSIVFRPEPFKLDTYNSNRWIVNPGDMVSDFLLRDFRNSGLFSGIFSFRDLEDARYVLEGSVEELVELDEGSGRSAALTLTVSLLDLSRSETSDRLVYQKSYQTTKPLSENSPEGVVNALSIGMAELSSEIIKDAYLSIQAPHN